MAAKDTQTNDLDSRIPETVKEFRYEGMIIKITSAKRSGTPGLVTKRIQDRDRHLTIYEREGKLYMHLTIESNPKQRLEVDVQRFLESLAEAMKVLFSSRINSNDVRFGGRKAIIITNFKLTPSQIEKKKAVFLHEYKVKKVSIKDIVKVKKGFGVIMDKEGKEYMVVVKDGNMDIFDLTLAGEKLEQLGAIIPWPPDGVSSPVKDS